MPKCVRCGVLKPVASFGFKKNATAMKQCAICRSKCRTYVNSDVGKTILKTYKETEKGKATIARCLKTPRSEASKLYVKQNHYLERCKVKRNEWNTSTRGQEVLERYKERRKELDKIRCRGLAQWNVANMCQFVEVQRAFGVCVLVLLFVLFQCVSPFGWHDHLAPLLKVDAPSPEHREYDVCKASLEQ